MAATAVALRLSAGDVDRMTVPVVRRSRPSEWRRVIAVRPARPDPGLGALMPVIQLSDDPQWSLRPGCAKRASESGRPPPLFRVTLQFKLQNSLDLKTWSDFGGSGTPDLPVPRPLAEQQHRCVTRFIHEA